MMTLHPSSVYKLDPVMKAKWVEALRSGRYPQAFGCLRNDKGYCCYGVACELAGIDAQWDNKYHRYVFDGVWANLPASVMRILVPEHPGQLASYSLYIPVYYTDSEKLKMWRSFTGDGMYYVALDVLNDASRTGVECGFTFSEIADLIEERL